MLGNAADMVLDTQYTKTHTAFCMIFCDLPLSTLWESITSLKKKKAGLDILSQIA